MERSLRSARERAVSRSERFIQVATELLYETGSLDFTVQELVERSKLSLRSFYQHFASKDVLLLAVFEEAIRRFVDSLRGTIDAEPDPLEKLRIYVTSFYGAGESSNRRASAALSRYLLMLTSDEPSELTRVLAPQVGILAEIVEAGAAAGRLRADLPPPVMTVLVTQALMSAVEMHVLGTQLTGQPVGADDVWEFCRGAVAAPDDAGSPGERSGPRPAPRRSQVSRRG